MTLDQIKEKALDIGERIFWTFITTYFTLTVTSGLTDMTQSKAAAAAGLAAAGAVGWNAIAQLVGVANGKTWWQDAIFRAFTTFIQAAGAILIVNGSLDYTQWKAAGLAGLTAVVTFLKGIALSRIGDPSTAGIFAVAGATGEHMAGAPAPVPPMPDDSVDSQDVGEVPAGSDDPAVDQ